MNLKFLTDKLLKIRSVLIFPFSLLKLLKNPRVRRGLLVLFLIWAVSQGFMSFKDQITQEARWVKKTLFLSYEEKFRIRTSPEFYDFITFVRRNTPENAVIMIPPQAWPWPYSGHIEYVQAFLYPRKIIRDDRQRLLTDKSITHVFLNWGEGGMADERLQGHPKYYVPVKKIIRLSGEKVLYPARDLYLEKNGLVEIERGENEKESLEGLQQETVEYYFHQTELLRAQGRFNEAVNSLGKAIQLKPNYAMLYYLLGDTWEKLGRLDLAIVNYDKAIVNNPENNWFYYVLGQVYEKVGREKEAIDAYQQNLEVSPDSVWSSYALGRIYEEKENFVNAYLFYEKANFAAWGPTSLDSKLAEEAMERLKKNNPGLLIKVEMRKNKEKAEGEASIKVNKEGVAMIFERIDDFDDKTSGVPSGELNFVEGVVGQAVSLIGTDNIAYPLSQFSPKEGVVEFYWRPPQDVSRMGSEETIDLLHQLGYWQKQDGSLYLWAAKNYLGFGMFDQKTKKWHLLSSEKLQWQPGKWYLITISFGKKGMSLALDQKTQESNDYQNDAAAAVIFLGGGRSIYLFDFPKKASIDFGSFDELVFYKSQDNIKK